VSQSDRRSRFESMFGATYDRVLAYVLRRADPADAEDVVSETFAVAWRRFDDVPADPLPWLYAVARRTLANSRRSVRRRAQLATRLASENRLSSLVESDPSEQLEEVAVMRAALNALAEADREVLMLVAWEGLDNERAAVVLGVSPQAFAVRLHRARRRLEGSILRLSGNRSPDESAATEES
jgi:RNA polymerase sigma-70 factor, ECF subfamily